MVAAFRTKSRRGYERHSAHPLNLSLGHGTAVQLYGTNVRHHIERSKVNEHRLGGSRSSAKAELLYLLFVPSDLRGRVVQVRYAYPASFLP